MILMSASENRQIVKELPFRSAYGAYGADKRKKVGDGFSKSQRCNKNWVQIGVICYTLL